MPHRLYQKRVAFFWVVRIPVWTFGRNSPVIRVSVEISARESFGCHLRRDLQNETSAEHSDCYREVIRSADLESATFVCHAVLAPAGLVARLWRDGGDHVEC